MLAGRKVESEIFGTFPISPTLPFDDMGLASALSWYMGVSRKSVSGISGAMSLLENLLALSFKG